MSLTEQANLNRISELLAELNTLLPKFFFAPISPVEEKKLIECVDNENGCNFITVGKTYPLEKEEEYCYWVWNDQKELTFYLKKYFKPFTAQNTIAQTPEPIKEERWNVSVQPFKHNIKDNRITIYYNNGNLTIHEAHKISDKIKQLLKEL